MSDPVTADEELAELCKHELPLRNCTRCLRSGFVELRQQLAQAELAARTNAETVVRQANELRRLAVSKSQQKRYEEMQK